MVRNGKRAVLQPIPLISLGNISSRICNEGSYQISVWLQAHIADVGRESTILDLKAVVNRKGKEKIQAAAFVVMCYFFLSSMKIFRKHLERESN